LRERADYDVYYTASKEEAEIFVERIKIAIEEVSKR